VALAADTTTDVLVLGGGPAGIQAALRAATLGADTTIVSAGPIGGMAAGDGPVPVRTLAAAARLTRESRLLDRFGIASVEPDVDYPRLLARVAQVVEELAGKLALGDDLERAGVRAHEFTGPARFVDPHTVVTHVGHRISARRIIICTGGRPRELDFPGADLTSSHSDAWALRDVPDRLVVIGSGATGMQVASIFDAFGSQVTLLEQAPRILPGEDPDVSAAMREALEESGVEIFEGFEDLDTIRRIEGGLRLAFRHDGSSVVRDADVIVASVGWLANTAGLGLDRAGIATDPRGYIEVDDHLRTNAPHVYAAGDVNGTSMLVPAGMVEGYYAATNALSQLQVKVPRDLIPAGSFTDPEYAQVGLTEPAARETHEVAVGRVDFAQLARAIIDGRERGFCKLIVDRRSHRLLGCHVVGERAVETVQLAAAGMAAGLRVEQLAALPLSFPTYMGAISWAARDIAE
jgi:pyruvate/2-oxoglutarate dehydrogenase complex dihydrolipoamide dehydrogenase (E3) component